MWLKIACRSAFFLKVVVTSGGEHSCSCSVQVELDKQSGDSSSLAEKLWGKRWDKGWEGTRERWAKVSKAWADPLLLAKLVCSYPDNLSLAFCFHDVWELSVCSCLLVAHVRMCHWMDWPANAAFLAPHFQTVNTAHDITSGQRQIRG